jgi:leader peptidase (prepilin peptidase)/N-methyltransferase
MDLETVFFFTVLVLFGLSWGSFLNVCIYRTPRDNFLKRPRSFCPHCEGPISIYQNIPILSFLFLKGRAACCQKKISLQYPIVEALGALMVVALYKKFPFYTGGLVDLKDLIRYLHGFAFCSILLTCSVIDIHLRIIPDRISLPMIALAPLWPLVHPELSFADSLLGILAGGGVVYAIAWTYFLIRRQEGIGMGDAKLLAGIGGWLGVQSIFPSFFYASLLGSLGGFIVMIITRDRSLKLEIPFGPFLSAGSLIHMVFGLKLLHWMAGV